MIAPERAAEQSAAVDAPFEGPLLAIVGPAGSGKTTALLKRFARIANSGVEPARLILASASSYAAARLRAPAYELCGLAEQDGTPLPWAGITLDRVALRLVATHALEAGMALDVRVLEEAEALALFERVGASLFALDWVEFLSAEIDPELAGLRTPERFAAATLRLIRKLRGAHIGPDEFWEAARRSAVAFYAKPPNFASPDLLVATREDYRDSLHVTPKELERQRRAEVDLAKVITRLYRSYLAELRASGCLTRGDSVAEATRLLAEHPAIAIGARETWAGALVDDVQDLTAGELRFLQALFGEKLAHVTFAGDRRQATQTFNGARPDRSFALAGRTFTLSGSFRVPPAIALAAALTIDPTATVDATAVEREPIALRTLRAPTQAREALFVANEAAALLNAGTSADDIAVIARALGGCEPYIGALLDAGVPVTVAGAYDLYDDRDAGDGLALLWSACDPFRHDWLLRALQTPMLRLTDATLQLLCGDPPSPQVLLFELPGDAEAAAGRWDRKRDLRLGMNVTRGDRDGDLPPVARERLAAFRARRAAWAVRARTESPAALAAAIFTEGGLLLPRAHESAARARFRGTMLAQLRAEIEAYSARDPRRTLHDFLRFAEAVAASDERLIAMQPAPRGTAVTVASVEAVKGREFAHVFVVNVRAGSFPPYYAPDAFLFSQKHGMIPKDNVGDARVARTAKFTWYMHFANLKSSFVNEERRALALAMTRARETVTVTTWGKATRGVGAPELQAELAARRLPGCVDCSADARMNTSTPYHALETQRSDEDEGSAQGAQTSLVQPALAFEDVLAAAKCPRCAREASVLRALAPSGHAAERATLQVPAGLSLEARHVPFAVTSAHGALHGTFAAIVRQGSERYAVAANAEGSFAQLQFWQYAAAEAGLCATALYVVGNDTVEGPLPVTSLVPLRAIIDTAAAAFLDDAHPANMKGALNCPRCSKSLP